jgi:AcrR family transcriptional regulator
MVVKEEVRDQIIESARQIFRKYGFRKSTMEEVAKSAGKGKSSIYYYFTSKEDIYKAVIEKEAILLRNEIQHALFSVVDPVEKIKVYVTVRMKTILAMINFYEAIRNEFLSHLDFINKIREKYDHEEILLVESILKEGVMMNKFTIDNTEFAAIGIVTALKGLEIPIVKYNKQINLDDRIHHLLEILFFGIVKCQTNKSA